MEVRKVFALKSFSENNQKIESEVWNPKWKMVTLRAQVGVKKQPVTAVKRHGSFRFSLAGKSKAGNLHIFTIIYTKHATASSRGTLCVSNPPENSKKICFLKRKLISLHQII